MLDCLVLGDSIAVGLANQLPQCVMEAKVGITSTNWLQEYILRQHETTIISLGTNDYDHNTYTNLLKLRNSIKSKQVFWILPSRKFNEARDAVRYVALLSGDKLIEINVDDLSPDRIHPTTQGYKNIASELK